MANGKIRFGKQSGGQLALVMPDGIDNTEVLFPESGDLVNKDYVDSCIESTKEYVDSLDSANIKLTGNQTISDVKTFTSSPIVPTPTAGDNSTKVATTAFVLANKPTINTSSVASAIAGITYGSIGSHALVVPNSGGVTLTPNQTLAGSVLKIVNDPSGSPRYPLSGTWRILGYYSNSSIVYVTLAVRIA